MENISLEDIQNAITPSLPEGPHAPTQIWSVGRTGRHWGSKKPNNHKRASEARRKRKEAKASRQRQRR